MDEWNHTKHGGLSFDFNINIPTLLAILGMVAAGSQWAARLEARTGNLEGRVTNIERQYSTMPERVAVIETRTEAMVKTLDEIKARK